MRKVSVQQKRRNALDLLLAFLLLLALAGILFAEVARSASAISRERATLSSFAVTDACEGYLFRNEEVLLTPNMGAIDYRFSDGDTVTAEQTVADVYTDTMQHAARITALYEEIGALEAALADRDAAWQLAYLAAWEDATKALSTGDYRGGTSAGAALADALLYRDGRSGDTARAAIEDRMALLQAELNGLLKYEQPKSVRAATDGVFYSAVDGLESFFGVEAVATLTPEGLLQKLTATAPDVGNTKPIGKLVKTNDFYLAVPLSAAKAAGYTVGNSYRIRLTRYGATVEVTLDRVAPSADGATALLILHGEALPILADAVRRQEIEIEREAVTGLALPLSALQTDGTREVVYVESEGKAVPREIRVLYRGEGVLLVAPDTGEGYLAAGEHVLVTERSLYEGRVVK